MRPPDPHRARHSVAPTLAEKVGAERPGSTDAGRPDENPGIKAVVFDLDGVIRHWPRSAIDDIERHHGLAQGALFAAAFDPSLLTDAITGNHADEHWRHQVAIRLSKRHGVDGASVVDAWSASRATIDDDVLQSVRSVRRRCRVVVLTNATSRLRVDLDAAGLTDEFDQVFSSAELGVAKPEPRCFQLVLEQLGIEPSNAAFIDDTLANVHAAQELGVHARHFVGVEPLRAFLGRLGFPRGDAA